MKFESNPPEAASLMMSARSFGNYDLPGAIADLIDNSIKARAKRIRIWCRYNAGEPEVRICDDGEGMSQDELIAAMRPASSNPTDKRAADDLGRFGWGMKSASFSQCRRLTVLTVQKGKRAGASWDLDDIHDWRMGVLSHDEVAEASEELRSLKKGTEIVWSRCDRLSENGTLGEAAFNDLVVYARSRLELIFHKFLSGMDGARRLSIEVNGLPLAAYDPFYRDHPATQAMEREDLPIQGENIPIRPYVLPHYSKLKMAEHEKLGGEEGFLRTQGFYVYRSHRLIIHGTWFRLAKFGEVSQLVRIGIDIPNSLDHLWKITVDKSDAQLPAALRERLAQIVKRLKGQAGRVYGGKGGKLDQPGKVAVWSRHSRNNEIRYSLNRDHPMIAALLESADGQAVSTLLRMIEQAFPVTSFSEDAGRLESMIHQTEADPARFIEDVDDVAVALFRKFDEPWEIVASMKQTEPWASNWPVVEEHFRNKGWVHD